MAIEKLQNTGADQNLAVEGKVHRKVAVSPSVCSEIKPNREIGGLTLPSTTDTLGS
jgi:hypothetical protein